MSYQFIDLNNKFKKKKNSNLQNFHLHFHLLLLQQQDHIDVNNQKIMQQAINKLHYFEHNHIGN